VSIVSTVLFASVIQKLLCHRKQLCMGPE